MGHPTDFGLSFRTAQVPRRRKLPPSVGRLTSLSRSGGVRKRLGLSQVGHMSAHSPRLHRC